MAAGENGASDRRRDRSTWQLVGIGGILGALPTLVILMPVLNVQVGIISRIKSFRAWCLRRKCKPDILEVAIGTFFEGVFYCREPQCIFKAASSEQASC